MQHLLRKTKVKIQRDFEESWSSTTHNIGVKREQWRAVNTEGSQLVEAGGLSPRSAWRTPPVSQDKVDRGVVCRARSPQLMTSLPTHGGSHVRWHQKDAASQMPLQQQQQLHHWGPLRGKDEKLTCLSRLDGRDETGLLKKVDSSAAARRVKEDTTYLSTSLLPPGQAPTGSPYPFTREQWGGGEGGGGVKGLYDMPKLGTSSCRDGHRR